ncbi:MAG: hypothetical protein JXR38_00035, partial [Bacilli bacterium]|nr:hypothetical protein [Bacilli bacterium]
LVFEKWPIHDPAKLVERTVEIVVSINGKVRDKITIATGTDQPTVEKLALELEKIKDLTSGKPIRKVIYVQDKLINLVI